MNFGLFSINAYASVEPRTLARVARRLRPPASNRCGREHVVCPILRLLPRRWRRPTRSSTRRSRSPTRGGDDASTARHRHHHPAQRNPLVLAKSWRVSTCCRAAG